MPDIQRIRSDEGDEILSLLARDLEMDVRPWVAAYARRRGTGSVRAVHRVIVSANGASGPAVDDPPGG